MRRFIVRLIKFFSLFFGIIAAALIPAEPALRKIPNDYTYKSNYLDKYSDSIELLFLGSSHALHGINPEFLHQRSFNAANFSQTLDYDLAILRKYEHRWNRLKYIIVPVDYFSLYYDLCGVEGFRVKNYVHYYHINLAPTRNIFNDYEVFMNTPFNNFKRLYNFYLRKTSDQECSELGWLEAPVPSKDLSATGAIAAKRHLRQSDEPYGYNLEVLKDMIAFGKSNGSRIIFYTSPAYQTYVENLDPYQLNKTVRTVEDLASLNKNVYYFNLLSDPAFLSADFYDGDHLNAKGAEKLTKKLGSLVDSLSDVLKFP